MKRRHFINLPLSPASMPLSNVALISLMSLSLKPSSFITTSSFLHLVLSYACSEQLIRHFAHFWRKSRQMKTKQFLKLRISWGYHLHFIDLILWMNRCFAMLLTKYWTQNCVSCAYYRSYIYRMNDLDDLFIFDCTKKNDRVMCNKNAIKLNNSNWKQMIMQAASLHTQHIYRHIVNYIDFTVFNRTNEHNKHYMYSLYLLNIHIAYKTHLSIRLM